MTILQLTTDFAGQTSVAPRTVRLVTTDSLTAITTAGYLNKAQRNGFQFQPSDFVFTSYGVTNGMPYSGTQEMFTLSFAPNGQITMMQDSTNIVLPTIANHIATYTNTSGTLSEDPATAISGGNIQAGLSGTAGAFISYPGTSDKGYVEFVATANTGNTVTTFTNAAMGQTTEIITPDPGAASAKALLDTGSGQLVSGASLFLDKGTGTEASNVVTINNQAGVITSSSLTVTGTGTYIITLTNSEIAASSVVLLQWLGGTNANANFTMSCAVTLHTATITIHNNAAATSISGTVLIGFVVV